MLAVIALTVLALQSAVADFHIGYSLRLYSNPNNSLANGSCCEDTCSSCNTILFFCFRDSLYPHKETSRSLCFFENWSDTTHLPEKSPQIKASYTGSFQLFINVIHVSDIAGFRQGLSDVEVKLIDHVFLELSNLTALPFELVSFIQTVSMEQMGDFGRVTIRIGLNAMCAQGFNGSDCSTFCVEDSNGNLTCEQVLQPSTTVAMQETGSKQTSSKPGLSTKMIVFVSVWGVTIGVFCFLTTFVLIKDCYENEVNSRKY